MPGNVWRTGAHLWTAAREPCILCVGSKPLLPRLTLSQLRDQGPPLTPPQGRPGSRLQALAPIMASGFYLQVCCSALRSRRTCPTAWLFKRHLKPHQTPVLLSPPCSSHENLGAKISGRKSFSCVKNTVPSESTGFSPPPPP